MITKKHHNDIAYIVGNFNLNEDFVRQLCLYFKNDNPRFSKSEFMKEIAKTRDNIFKEFQRRDDKYKKEYEFDKLRQCSLCGKQYRGFPAISKRDDKTEICPDCGVNEVFEIFLSGVKK